MLIGVLGGFGSGKTLLLAVFGYKLSFNPKYVVYSNFRIKNVEYLTPRKLLDINPKEKKAVILLDEVYSWLDSRVSISKINRILSWVVLQSRKRNMDIIYSAQLGSSVDLRLRDMTDIIIYCECLGNPVKPKGFAYLIEWQKGFRNLRRRFFFSFKTASKFFDVYDTREIVKPLGLEKLKKGLE